MGCVDRHTLREGAGALVKILGARIHDSPGSTTVALTHETPIALKHGERAHFGRLQVAMCASSMERRHPCISLRP